MSSRNFFSGCVFSSGLSAVMAITNFLKTDDHIICCDDVYGGLLSSNFVCVCVLVCFKNIKLGLLYSRAVLQVKPISLWPFLSLRLNGASDKKQKKMKVKKINFFKKI
jgi:hypothetical protein